MHGVVSTDTELCKLHSSVTCLAVSFCCLGQFPYHPILQLSRATTSWSIQNISSAFETSRGFSEIPLLEIPSSIALAHFNLVSLEIFAMISSAERMQEFNVRIIISEPNQSYFWLKFDSNCSATKQPLDFLSEYIPKRAPTILAWTTQQSKYR